MAFEDLLREIDVTVPSLGTKWDDIVWFVDNATEKVKTIRATFKKAALALDMATESLKKHDPETLSKITEMLISGSGEKQ